MKQICHLEEIFPPEYYHEIPGYDSRIAIRKMLDVLSSLGDASIALTFSNIDEYEEDSVETQIIRRTHLRHALIDLNNSFDLLLQIPWFYYRIGLGENSSIERNIDGWVEKLESECKIWKVRNFLLREASDCKQKILGEKITDFKNSYMYCDSKPFTVRSVANDMKHRSTIKLKEFDSHLKLKIDGLEQIEELTRLKQNQIKKEFVMDFYDSDSPLESIGKIEINGVENGLINIKYNNGEEFRGKDYAYTEESFSFDDIYGEAIDFYDNFLELFDCIYHNIYLEIPQSPVMNKRNAKKTSETLNVDKWYKC
ncbi:hypothetical protein [Acetobacterium bakii]|uniref:Uncharacterized protein n=1 Tax=Acetobacterium bakii TaxID=52689 RepID=A0A0L6U250_9FIRM|nr:hypothetical protein [Acetobacterium bakii]KNZ41850.1 hypothetical protein AKG39_09530 [Acetobacterium bakii]